MGRAPDRTRLPEDGLGAALQAGDEWTFGALLERHRRELRVHCYRMLGSFEDAEDLVQETFLHAWRSRATFTFQGVTSFRAWLYRIATNLCLDRLERRPRRVLPSELGPAADPRAGLQPPADLPWLQPYPDRLLEDVSPSNITPDEAVVSKETIELTFLAAIQFLPPRQRAVLIVRDVLDWSAKETASLLGSSVASVNSALQRARATLKTRLPASRLEWSGAADRSAAERQLLRRYIDAYESADLTELADVLREDARLVMPPYLEWYDGRASIVAFAQAFSDPGASGFRGELRGVPTHANRQPAVAWYLRPTPDATYHALSLDVLPIENGTVADITAFVLSDLFAAFGLAPTPLNTPSVAAVTSIAACIPTTTAGLQTQLPLRTGLVRSPSWGRRTRLCVADPRAFLSYAAVCEDRRSRKCRGGVQMEVARLPCETPACHGRGRRNGQDGDAQARPRSG